jgi:hypothetical protein
MAVAYKLHSASGLPVHIKGPNRFGIANTDLVPIYDVPIVYIWVHLRVSRSRTYAYNTLITPQELSQWIEGHQLSVS